MNYKLFKIASLLHCWHEIFLLSLCEYKFDVPWMNLIHSGKINFFKSNKKISL